MRKNDLADAANDAVKLIAEATSKATAAIASAASDAAKVVAENALTAAKVVADRAGADRAGAISLMEDHNLLVRLEEKIEGIKTDIKDLKDGTSQRISTLELCKVDIKESYPSVYKMAVDKELDDHEDRIRITETNITRMMTWGSVAIVLLNIIMGIIIRYVH
jgi:hypothetical protein